MADIDLTYKGRKLKKHQKPKGTRKKRAHPRDPDRVLAVVRLKDIQDLSWREIGPELGLSHQAPYLLYKRWRKWAYETGGL